MTDAFQYPSQPLIRKHDPLGYQAYESYKPLLRDEFSFRCVYCLCRERWFPDGEAAFSVDHMHPQSQAPGSIQAYENLLYACCQCNAIRGTDVIPDPCVHPYGELLELLPDATLSAVSHLGRELIAICRLNRPKLVAFRRGMCEVLALLKQRDDPQGQIVRHYLGYPDSLPNLSVLNPPGGNAKPQGITESYFAQRQQGRLAAVY